MIESNPTFIVAAYAVTWIVLLGYLLVNVRRDRRVRSEYEGMVHQNSVEKRQ